MHVARGQADESQPKIVRAETFGTNMNSLRVLVIDDEPAVRQIIAAHVKQAGYSVDQAGSASLVVENLPLDKEIKAPAVTLENSSEPMIGVGITVRSEADTLDCFVDVLSKATTETGFLALVPALSRDEIALRALPKLDRQPQSSF